MRHDESESIDNGLGNLFDKEEESNSIVRSDLEND